MPLRLAASWRPGSIRASASRTAGCAGDGTTGRDFPHPNRKGLAPSASWNRTFHPHLPVPALAQGQRNSSDVPPHGFDCQCENCWEDRALAERRMEPDPPEPADECAAGGHPYYGMDQHAQPGCWCGERKDFPFEEVARANLENAIRNHD